MKDSAYKKLMIALTAAGPIATVASAAASASVGFDLSVMPFILISAAGGFALGWALCYWRAEKRRTPHNRLCREILAKLGELPKDERFPYVANQLEHEKVDGRTDFSNALRSLIEQDCIRGIEIRDYLDGGYNAYAGPHFGVTGKRYTDD